MLEFVILQAFKFKIILEIYKNFKISLKFERNQFKPRKKIL